MPQYAQRLTPIIRHYSAPVPLLKINSKPPGRFLNQIQMIPASKEQKQRIAILTKGDKEFKAALVYEVTQDENKTSTNDLKHHEANQIIQHLGGKPLLYDNWALFDKNNQKHRQILSLCIQYGWSVPHPKLNEIADIGRLSEWIKNDPKCPVHKKLKKMDAKELSKIIVALEGMIKWKYKK